MKRFLWLVGGVCAAAAGFLVWGAKQLAHSLEEAWAGHNTVV